MGKYFVICLWICGWDKKCSTSSGAGSPAILILDGMWCSPVEFQSKALLAATFLLAVFLAYFSFLKMGTICFFKISVNFHRTTRCHIPENGTFHSPFIQNFRSSILILSCWEWIQKCCLPVKIVIMLENINLILNVIFKLVIQCQYCYYVVLMIGWVMNVE
jgi:hypothetical protein